MKEKSNDGNLPGKVGNSSLRAVQFFVWLFLSVLLTVPGFAQMVQNIKGTVIEATSRTPIPGVAVVVKGTTYGTTTDVNGVFNLNSKPASVLTISSIGFKTQDIELNGRTEIIVVMEADVTDIDEVVVVGYGVQKKKLVTGATLQVDGESLQKLSTTSALQALQGQTPGVQISSTSGQPGEGLKVVVRGMGTIGNSGPLYLVDGVQTGDISYLNNADIERIDVLKDAASAAIYGSQAANGVVLITTKSGSKGKAQISFDSYYGVQNVARKVDMLNSREYAVLMNESAINSGKAPYFSADEITAMGNGTNWMDEMFYDNAVTQNYTLGVTGGGNSSVYSISLSYTGQEGIVGGPSVSNYDRYNFRVNTEHSLYNDIIKVGQHLSFGYMEKNGIGVGNQYNNTLRSAFNTSPFLPMYDDSGNYLNNTKNAGVMYNGAAWDPWNDGESNPYALMMLTNQNKNNNQKLFGDVYVEANPIKGLKLKTTFGIDFYTSEGRSFTPKYQLSMYAEKINDSASQNLSKGFAWTWDNIASYDFKIKEHSFSAMLGMSAYQNKGSWLNVSNADLVISDLEHAYIDNTTNTDLTKLSYGGAPNDESMLVSYFGRLSYNYKETYMLNATFRRDGSSRFDSNHRWGNFPSVSAGWVASNESFMESTSKWLSFLKIRASWGQVGNQNIAAWQYLAPVLVGEGYRDGDNNVIQGSNYYFGSEDFNASGNATGAYPQRLANLNLRWETSEQTNLGFDARLIDSKLGVNLDWYRKTTKDWLIKAPILATAGADAPYINGGNVKNTGIELAVSWNDKIGDFKYFVNANISKNKNEVTDVPTSDGIVHGLTNMLYDNAAEFYHRAETGYPIGYFWGWKTDGVFQNVEEVASYKNAAGKVIQPKAQPGDLRYIDMDGNGSIDEGDKTMVGDPNPDYTFGFTFGCDYKHFDFSVSANGVAGNQIVQTYRNHANGFANYTSEFLGRWHGEGTSNRIPRVTETNINYLFSDLFVKDGDFLRISNITLGYDFSKLAKCKYLSQARLYTSVLNAFTFTKYNGMDPEVGYGLENGSSGVDVGYYPRPRTILVGVSVKF